MNVIYQFRSNTTNMQGVVTQKSEHNFGAFRYITDLWRPTQKNAGKIHKATESMQVQEHSAYDCNP